MLWLAFAVAVSVGESPVSLPLVGGRNSNPGLCSTRKLFLIIALTCRESWLVYFLCGVLALSKQGMSPHKTAFNLQVFTREVDQQAPSLAVTQKRTSYTDTTSAETTTHTILHSPNCPITSNWPHGTHATIAHTLDNMGEADFLTRGHWPSSQPISKIEDPPQRAPDREF